MAKPVTQPSDSSPPRTSKKETPVIYISSPSSSSSYSSSPDRSYSENDETPLRPIICLKNNDDVKRYEEIEDCFILDFDPSASLAKLSVSDKLSALADDDDDDAELSVVAEKGKVACRDYPHSRHLCVKFPFDTTSHETYCELCYCYVCDSAAPCKDWTKPQTAHCHASEKVGNWNYLRKMKKLEQSQV